MPLQFFKWLVRATGLRSKPEQCKQYVTSFQLQPISPHTAGNIGNTTQTSATDSSCTWKLKIKIKTLWPAFTLPYATGLANISACLWVCLQNWGSIWTSGISKFRHAQGSACCPKFVAILSLKTLDALQETFSCKNLLYFHFCSPKKCIEKLEKDLPLNQKYCYWF